MMSKCSVDLNLQHKNAMTAFSFSLSCGIKMFQSGANMQTRWCLHKVMDLAKAVFKKKTASLENTSNVSFKYEPKWSKALHA